MTKHELQTIAMRNISNLRIDISDTVKLFELSTNTYEKECLSEELNLLHHRLSDLLDAFERQ